MAPEVVDEQLSSHFLNKMIRKLPTQVQDRVVALKNKQLVILQHRAMLRKDIIRLRIKYQERYQPLLEVRKLIVTGELDPPKVKPKWNTDGEGPNDLEQQEFAEQLKEFKNYPADSKGIPYFWLKIFRNTEMLNEMVTERDEQALKKLKDISVKYGDDFSYTLEFHFDENDYFTNAVLTKHYFLKASVHKNASFNYNDRTAYKCEGCTIDWKKGMDLTVDTVRVKKKTKARGTVRTVAKRIPVDSFFNFFAPPEEVEKELMHHFDIADFLCDCIIPQAVLYYDGTMFDD